VAYSNDPHPNAYAHIWSPIPNIDFPTPYWINKLKNMAIIGCLNPDLVYAELAVAAAAKLGWTVLTPSTKQIIEEATGRSWLCHSKQVISNVDYGQQIANNAGGRFLYGVFAGLDIAAYHAFMLSTGAQGIFDFASYAFKFARKCDHDQSPYRGLTPVGGWASDVPGWTTGPEFLNQQGSPVGALLVVPPDSIAVMVAWCNFSNLGGTGGVVTSMRIHNVTTGEVLDSNTVDNRFSLEDFAIVQAFTIEGRVGFEQWWWLEVNFEQSVGARAVPVNGGCYMRAWSPGLASAPPYWNMKTMLGPGGNGRPGG
jgi:hypothetical protein